MNAIGTLRRGQIAATRTGSERLLAGYLLQSIECVISARGPDSFKQTAQA